MKPKIISTISILSLLLFSLACQAGAPIMSIFATDTLTPSITPSPTVTPTITPSPTMTFTPTPVPEVEVRILADGSTEYTDHKGGYTMSFGNGWWVLDLAVEDPKQVLDDAKDIKPELSAQLESLNFMVALNARMAAFELTIQPNIFESAPVLYSTLDPTSAELPLELILKSNAEILPQILNAKVKNEGIKENKNDISYGILHLTLSVTSDGKTKSAYERMAIFQTEGYTVAIIFVADDEFWDTALPAFEEVIDSIKLLEQ